MPTLGLPIPQSSDSVAFEGGYDAGNNRTAVKQLDSSTTANGTTYGPQLVVTSALSGYVATALGQPTATTANTDTAWSFAQTVNHILIQNNTTDPLNFEFETAATAGSLVLPATTSFRMDLKVTTIHFLTPAVQNINGSAADNIVIRGWL